MGELLTVLRNREWDCLLHNIGLRTVTLQISFVFDVCGNCTSTKAAQGSSIEATEVVTPNLNWCTTILRTVGWMNSRDLNLRVVSESNRVDRIREVSNQRDLELDSAFNSSLWVEITRETAIILQ